MQKFWSWIDDRRAALHRTTASREFRAFAQRFVLTRPIARKRAKQLFDLCAGFVYSQVLLACVRLNLFDMLVAGPQSVEVLSRRLGLDADVSLRLLDAATALKLLSRMRNGHYALGPLGAAMVDNPAVASMVEHHSMVYADLQDPLQVLRGASNPSLLADYWSYAGAREPQTLSTAQVQRYSALMTASQPLIADEVMNAYPLHKHRCLLDVGGGEGAFVTSVARRISGLKLQMFDLPAVAELAKIRISAEGLRDRIVVHGGSFKSDSLPAGADIISLVRILHDHDDETVRTILRAVRQALPADGVVLIAEPMSGNPNTSAMADAYFGFYLLLMGRGRARSAERLGDLLNECGFSRGQLFRTHLPIQTQVLVARPCAHFAPASS
jgi:demethylspheroidene O-methyltransferase